MPDKYGFLNFTLIDFETSGLDPKTEQIIEAAVLRVRDGVPVMTFNTLVELREGKTLSPKITELTGHAEGDLIGAVTEDELIYVLDALIGENEMIVAYNALFDLSFLNELYNRTIFSEANGYVKDAYEMENPFLDPLTIARDREPFPHKLIDVCKRNGLVLDDAHSAEADTLALLDVVLKYHKDKDISEWVNVAGYRPKYGEPSWYPKHAVLKKQGSEIVSHYPSKAKPKPITSNIVVSKRQKKTPVPGDRPEDLP